MIQDEFATKIRWKFVLRQTKASQAIQDVGLGTTMNTDPLSKPLSHENLEDREDNLKEAGRVADVNTSHANWDASFDRFHVHFRECSVEL